MTTIAWDGKVLAGDTLSVNGSFCREVVKIHRVQKDIYFGAAGYLEDAYKALAWLRQQDSERPELDESFTGIVVEKGKAYRIEAGLIYLPIKEPYHAVGSGADCAIVALYLGKSAVEAIKIASLFDVNTGSKVTSMPALVVSKTEVL